MLAFFQPFPGLILGIVGLVQSKKEKSKLSKVARKLNIWGIVISIILIIISIGFMIYALKGGNFYFPDLPIQ